ncbi:MAG: TRAM domain-containing protein, partial [Desulfocucumaceae bacterium]
KDISYINNQSKVGSVVQVIVDRKKPGRSRLYYGRTGGDAPEVDGSVLFSAGGFGEIAPGRLVNIRITKGFDYGLRGVLLP